MFRHVEGDLDGERAGVLRGVDDGDGTRADGDQRQGDLAEWTVSIAWGWKERGRRGGQRSHRGPFMHPQEDALFSCLQRSRNLIQIKKKASRSILRNPFNLSSDLWPRFNLAGALHGITSPIQTSAEQPFRHTSLSKYTILLPLTGIMDWLFWLPFRSSWTPISKPGYAE